jgi:hypothetical protein
MAVSKNKNRTQKLVWFDNDILARIYELKGQRSAQDEINHLLALALDMRAEQPPEPTPNISAPEVNTTMPEHQGDILSRTTAEDQLEQMFAYLQRRSDKKIKQSDIEDAIFLIAIICSQRLIKNNNQHDTLFANTALRNLKPFTPLSISEIRAELNKHLVGGKMADARFIKAPAYMREYTVSEHLFESVDKMWRLFDEGGFREVLIAPFAGLGNCICVGLRKHNVPHVFRIEFLNSPPEATQLYEEFCAYAQQEIASQQTIVCQTYPEIHELIKYWGYEIPQDVITY